MKSLGAENMQEAMAIVQAAGIESEDINELMMDQAIIDANMQKPKLTRRQQLGIDPIPASMETLGTQPNFKYLPEGISAADLANMSAEEQYLVEQQMIAAQQQAYAQVMDQEIYSEQLVEEQEDAQADPLKKKVKAHRLKGLVEWIVD